MIESWQTLMRNVVTDKQTLVKQLELPNHLAEKIEDTSAFGLRIPQRIVDKMEKGRIDGPLAKQYIPLTQEREVVPGFCCDPVGESQVTERPKLLQKYQKRVLLLTTSACAMHCRYCFRRHFPYTLEQGLDQELEMIRNDPTISEVLLSGGDPLSLPNRSFAKLLEKLNDIPHLERIRIHTRFLLGIPERITDAFVKILKQSKKTLIFVIHLNHPKELDQDIKNSLQKLNEVTPFLFTHTVLLKGVNDTFETLETLFLTCIAYRLIPYYLFALDRVQGAHHFHVPDEEGLELYEKLRRSLPGYALPRFVREEAGKPYKIPVQ